MPGAGDYNGRAPPAAVASAGRPRPRHRATPGVAKPSPKISFVTLTRASQNFSHIALECLPVPNLRANENEAHDKTSPECH